jgi:arylsulfatase A-like enzyme
MPLTRRSFLSAAAAPAIVRRRRPNVVVFMTDDHGPWATSVTGCAEIRTPNVERLAKTGTLFTRAYAATPVCSPSRMTCITGLLPSHHGVQDWLQPADAFGPKSRRWLEGKSPYSDHLRAAGYTLGMTGKWHMGLDDTAQAGFSYWATVPGGGGTFRNASFVRNGETIKTEGFKEDRIGDFALEFLGQQKNRRDPFFLLMPFYAPHTPYDFQPEAARRPYENARFNCYPLNPVHPNQNPGLARHHGNRESMLSYSALITAMDLNVGRVLETLDKMGAREDTTVVFTADQGWNAGHHGVWGKGNGTWPFNLYEEAVGVPMVWSHPGRIPQGERIGPLISHYDLYPTLLDWTGVKAPADSRRPGQSYVPFLRGEEPAWRDAIFFEYSYVRGVRAGRWKLTLRAGGFPGELYDLLYDPEERKNLFADAAHAEIRARLEKQIEEFFRAHGAPPLERWRETTKQDLPKYSNRG